MIKDITTQKPEKLSTSQLKQIPLFRLKRTFGATYLSSPRTHQIVIITQCSLWHRMLQHYQHPEISIPFRIHPSQFTSEMELLYHNNSSWVYGGIVQDTRAPLSHSPQLGFRRKGTFGDISGML